RRAAGGKATTRTPLAATRSPFLLAYNRRGATPRPHFPPLGFLFSPAAAGRRDARGDGTPRLARGDADRRREVALLSGAGASRRHADRRRLAAHLADERPGRRPHCVRRRRGTTEQL